LYPLQNRVLAIFKDTPFYLTGGTALSRGYFHHRYSDDLDLFVNDHNGFERLVSEVFEKLRNQFPPAEVVVRESAFCQIFLGVEQLKVELINDVPAHVGDFVDHPELGRLDSCDNILANKVAALIDRAHPKDVVDLYFLLKSGLSLKQALTDANSKAAGITPLLVARILAEFHYEQLASIRWIITDPDKERIRRYLTAVARGIVNGDGT